MNIKILLENDIENIYEVWNKSGLSVRLAGRDSRDSIKSQMKEKGIYYFGVFDGEILCGVALLTHDFRKAWINRLAVLPEYRKRGISKLLINHCEKRALEDGVFLTASQIEDGNDPSMNAFRACGYEEKRDIIYFRKFLKPVW